MKLILAAIIASLLAAPVLAADQSAKDSFSDKAKPAAANPAKKPDAEKLICHREAETGSFLAKRVCQTQAQIDADREAAAKLAERNQVMGNRLEQQNSPR
ncbi:hypothetical protein BH11PSE2_BH11PSE2_16150 [soil metagenome]